MPQKARYTLATRIFISYERNMTISVCRILGNLVVLIWITRWFYDILPLNQLRGLNG